MNSYSFRHVLLLVLLTFLSLYMPTASASPLMNSDDFPIKTEYSTIYTTIDGENCELQNRITRPDDNLPHPLIILTHGRNQYTPPRNPQEVNSCQDTTSFLAKKGYVVAYLVRRGYGNSVGSDVEYKYTRNASFKCGFESSKDIKACLDFMSEKSYVDKNKIIIGGHSVGGLATIVTASRNFDGVVGYLNFAAFSVDVNENDLTGTCRIAGKTAKAPMLWLYSSGDQFLQYVDVTRLNKAFQESGGNSKLVFTRYVENGHNIMKRYPDWLRYVDEFFDSIGFQ